MADISYRLSTQYFQWLPDRILLTFLFSVCLTTPEMAEVLHSNILLPLCLYQKTARKVDELINISIEDNGEGFDPLPNCYYSPQESGLRRPPLRP